MPLESLNIFQECENTLEFGEIKKFLKKSFGTLDIRIIKTRRKIVQTKGIIFDAVKTQKVFLDTYRKTNCCNIIITDRIFATLDENRRPHVRAAYYGFPSVISLSGIVEGPAKPKEFYIFKRRYDALGMWHLKESQVKKKFKNQFIDYQDRRMTDIMKGYISQAIFFYVTGNPFCEKKACRLFNAHWQKDLLYSQITRGEFCSQHKKILEKIRQI